MTWRSINRVAVTVASLLISVVAFAVPATAADGPTMPSVKGLKLSVAADTIDEATKQMIAEAPSDIQKKLANRLKVHPVTTKGPQQDIYNYTNWYVCWQSPKANAVITPKAWVTVGVRRPGEKCW